MFTEFSSTASGFTVWRRLLFGGFAQPSVRGCQDARGKNRAQILSVANFFRTIVPGVITPVDEDGTVKVAATSIRDAQARCGWHLAHGGSCPSVVALHAVGPQSRRVAAIAVAISVFVLAILDVIDPYAAHEIKGVARDVDVGLFIRLDADKGIGVDSCGSGGSRNVMS